MSIGGIENREAVLFHIEPRLGPFTQKRHVAIYVEGFGRVTVGQRPIAHHIPTTHHVLNVDVAPMHFQRCGLFAFANSAIDDGEHIIARNLKAAIGNAGPVGVLQTFKSDRKQRMGAAIQPPIINVVYNHSATKPERTKALKDVPRCWPVFGQR